MPRGSNTVKHSPSALSTAALAVIAALGVPLPRSAVAQSTTPTFVQGAAFSTGSRVSTLTVPFTLSVGQGDLLVGWFSQFDAPEQVQVSDDLNGTRTRVPGSLTFMSDTGDIALYYRENSQAAPGGMTITVSVSSTAYLQGTVADYSGVALAGSLDQIAAARDVGTAVDTGATAAVDAGELVFAALVTGGDPGSVTPGSSVGVPYTARAQTSNGSSYEEDIVSSAAGAQDGTATLASATDWYAVCAVFHLAPATPQELPSTPAGLEATSVASTRVAHPHPDRAGCGRRPARRLVQPVRRSGRGAGFRQRQWPVDALGFDDVQRSGRHRPLLQGELRCRALGPRDHGVGVRARLSAGSGGGLPRCSHGGSARPGRGLGRPGDQRQRGSDRLGPRRRAGRGGRRRRRPAGLRDSRKQPAGAVRPRRAQRQRLLPPRGHPVQRRGAAGGEPDPLHGQQLVHGARHLPSRFHRFHHDHHTTRDDHPRAHRPTAHH